VQLHVALAVHSVDVLDMTHQSRGSMYALLLGMVY
jgi:hypothetical protein